MRISKNGKYYPWQDKLSKLSKKVIKDQEKLRKKRFLKTLKERPVKTLMGHYDFDESKVKPKTSKKKLNIKKKLKNIKTTNSTHITKQDIISMAATIRYIIQDDGINPVDDKDLDKFEKTVRKILTDTIGLPK